jgi:RNA polymerase sigma factor (sigma-70 family)
MKPAEGKSILSQLRRTLRADVLECAPDEELLGQFVAERDEAAFAAIVRRHGPMVWAVCQRVLVHRQDAEDAFQATFLVLARKATAIGRRKLLANWLFGVARRAALSARAMRARRARHEQSCAEPPDIRVTLQTPAGDIRAILDEELARMPKKYRLPLLLCGLEGMTHAEAGKQLGWPTGTVAGRLSRGRELLRTRLLRRGIAVPAAVSIAAFLPGTAPAAVPTQLVAASVQNAVASILCGKSVAVAAPPTAAALTRALLLKMLLARVWATAALIVSVAATLGGAGTLWYWAPATKAPVSSTGNPTPKLSHTFPPEQHTSTAPRPHTVNHANVNTGSLRLPSDEHVIVLKMDRSVVAPCGPSVVLTIYADGHVMAQVPDGLCSFAATDLTQYAKELHIAESSGTHPIPQKTRIIEGSLPAAELHGLLRFALQEQEFFAFDADKVKATIHERYLRDAEVADPNDNTITTLCVQTASRKHEVRWFRLDKAAWDFPKVERLLQLHALDQRLSQVFYVLLAGGPERVDAVVGKMNELAEPYYRLYPQVPPLTAADLFKVTASANSACMRFTFSRKRDRLVRNPSFEVSIDVPLYGEPTLGYVWPPG